MISVSKTNRKILGFTLIELLVVVSIISLLSSLVLTAVKDGKDKAQQRAYTMYIKDVQRALELYKNDKGKYPLTPDAVDTLSSIITNYLSAYNMKYTQPSSSFKLENNTVLYEVTSNTKYYSCGATNYPQTSEYTILLHSSRNDLTFPKRYFYGVIANSGPYYTYCFNFI